MFETQSNTIKSFMSDKRTILFENALIFACVWYFFLIMTSGTACPLGIFIPSILIGCALGHMYRFLHYAIFPLDADPKNNIPATTFAIMGATAMLAGATRMTYSLAVIMLETTSSVELFLPIIFTLFISYGSGTILIDKSIYLGALRTKNIPLLVKDVPKVNRHLRAQDLMAAPVRKFHFLPKVEDISY